MQMIFLDDECSDNKEKIVIDCKLIRLTELIQY